MNHGPSSAVGEDVFDVVPAANEAAEPVPGRAVLLAGEPEDAKAVLAKQLELAGLRADPAVDGHPEDRAVIVAALREARGFAYLD